MEKAATGAGHADPLDAKKRLVTAIEVLSHSNKAPGEHGRALYVRKQQKLLRTKTNLVEIDLLRSGAHSTAVSLDRLRAKAGAYDYHVCMHRFDNLEDHFVYPIGLAERLPDVAIPLLPEDADVKLNLQNCVCRMLRSRRLRSGHHLRVGSPSTTAHSRARAMGDEVTLG